MYNNKYIIGLDIGISSVGWGLLQLDENNNPCRIIDVGSRIFSPGEVEKTGDSKAKERREKRGARRIIRRREFRVDRVRKLLHDNSMLVGNLTSNIVSQQNEELTLIYNEAIERYYKEKHTNPYRLKVEALDRKLEAIELAIILVHYAKKRGYKSNREENSGDNESGKVLNAIKENEKLMKENNYRTISEMYVNNEKFKNKIKNGPDDYKVSVTREMYLEEINKVLDSQIKFGLIDDNFKEEYIKIWGSQRHYSSGPGYYYVYDENGGKAKRRSQYGGNLIEKMTGKCKFDDLPRAPKMAFSSELFVALTKVLNTRYKSDENLNYIGFTSVEIKQIIELAKEKNVVTYGNIVDILKQTNIKFKDLQLSKEDFKKVIAEFKKKLNISKDQKIDINKLNDEEKNIYNNLYNKKLMSKTLIELKGYHILRTKIEKAYNKDIWNSIKDNIDLLDELALFCTNYKLNDEIKLSILNSNNIPDEFADDDFVEILPNFKDHLMLSTNIVRQLIPLMLEGKRYDEAMNELDYPFNDVNSKIEKHDLLVPINKVDTITNQRVVRSLTQARKVLNAIIKKYGTPYCINIETAKELAKSRQERKEIEKAQKDKYEKNQKDKLHLVELGLFENIDKISSNDLLKYRLWMEQKERCGYSLKPIRIEQLFNTNEVQIDHILPYSRTFNDNYLNKTLVLTKYNQDKGNRTPFEWFGNTSRWQEYEIFINGLNISSKKKDNYLLRNLDSDLAREMREQNLNDTKYISKEFASLIKAYLNVEKVNVYQGTLTAKLRARWGFNRLTHSYISPTYIMPSDMKEDINKDRDNHLHHAMDALIIAATTKSLQQKITLYEKFSRYIDGKTRTELNAMSDEELMKHDLIIYDDETGEIDDKLFKDYIREEELKNNIYYGKHNVARLKFPLPYEKFDEEAKARVYERDLNVLKNDMQSLSTYTNDDINRLKVLIPSIAKNKVSGKMHEETYYGIKEFEVEDSKEIYKTIRKSLSRLSKKDIENFKNNTPDKNGGSKDIYNTIVDWIGDCETGEEAFKKHNNSYPINPNDIEKKQIKKIKIYEKYNNTGHMINGSNVEKGSIYQIDIFKSKDKEDDKLYFAGLDMLEIENLKAFKKGKNIDFPIKLEYAQGKNNLIINYHKVLEEYEQIMSLRKNDLIKITNKNNQEVIAYVVGFSSGMLEVKSKLGDGYDLVGEGKVFETMRNRFQITISTIAKIEKLSISILGEISGV